jgi:Ribbon-helix-helix protein, copG family.
MARPRIYKNGVVISIFIDKELAKELSNIAKERGISRSMLISEILLQYVSQYNSQYNKNDSKSEEKSEIEEHITREISSIKSLIQRLIKYCGDNTECAKELINKYRDAIMNKLVSIEDLAIKYKVTTAIPEIEKTKQMLNSYR